MAPVAFEGAPIREFENYLKNEVLPSKDPLTINYVPSFEGYKKISALVKANLASEENPPSGFPPLFDGPQNWTASDLTEQDYLVRLVEEDVKSIEDAVKAYLEKHDTVGFITQETFPISDALKAKMNNTVSNLFDGRGFAIMRGLNASKYTPLERVVIFLGLSCYVGSKLGMQALNKNALSHLTNLKPFYAEGLIKSPGYTNVQMSFHNDCAHIIALFVVGVADHGGASMVASSTKIYNELAATKPHVLKTLAENWKLNKFSGPEFNSGDYYDKPLLYNEDGRPILYIARKPFTGSSPGDKPMPLTMRQAEALDCIHFTAEPHAVSLKLEEGDLQFLNNLAVVHSRETFKDSSIGEGEGRRHIIRASIKNEERAYKLPEQLKGAFNEIYPEIPASEFTFLIDPFADPNQAPPSGPVTNG